MPNTIEPLPDATRSRLRSTQLLVSLPQIVSELVQNALDACASQLDVSLDADGWSCTVRDNGAGVPRASLSSLAQRYNTSKTYSPSSSSSPSSFGFRGEALASVADVCVLELATRTKADNDCWSIVLKGGELLHCGSALRNRVTGKHGTVVCVRDAFYNLPVRRMSHPSVAKTLQLVRREMETYALACPHVAFSLETVSSGAGSSKNAGKVFTVPKARDPMQRRIPTNDLAQTMSVLATFRRLYGKALADADVNHHPVISSDLARSVDSAFAASTFAKHPTIFADQRRSPRKMEKHPVYVLDITLPTDGVDNCLEPSKSTVQFKELRKVCDFLASAVKAFLERHGFRAATLKRREVEEDDGSPRKRRRIDLGSTDIGSRPRSPFTTPRKTPMSLRHDDEMEWTDPNTGAVHIVDKRTGTSVLRLQDNDAESPASVSRAIVDTRSLRKRPLGQDQSTMPSWMQAVLEVGLHAPFERDGHTLTLARRTPRTQAAAAAPISKACCPTFSHSRSHSSEVSFTRDDLRAARVLGQVDRKFVACVLAGGALVLVDQHAADERIRVERFLAELCGTAEVSKVELDVEAPDGRKGLPVLLTRREAEMLAHEKYRVAFARWGVEFDTCGDEEEEPQWKLRVGGADDVDTGPQYVQVWVRSVPEVVADKLAQDNELRDLLKGYLATLEADGIPPALQPKAKWNTVLQHCPRQLVELANSKACRGSAIMFNDTLNLDRCTRLIAELADTRFPFQCAHGRLVFRPSLLSFVANANYLGLRWRRLQAWIHFCNPRVLDRTGMDSYVA
ncbi:hypothetical protein AURDEDRAFT_53673 [Auricularia subglabra TFB-10046 SS5]|nr:hypothetical protein AURDEDRAFT_53673 [Auricularia subglabra TFB-10046 SS5]